jgi:cell division protein ZapE
MSQHTLPPTLDDSTSPMLWYKEISKTPGFIYDAAQENAIIELEKLWYELVDFKSKRNQFLGRSLLSPDVPKGLYLYGGVGRGKSFLMDMFYACVPFMSEVHHELKALSAHQDPLLALADKIEKSIRLLCFDEFHVSDIADAMILGRLMEAMFERGVVMIITANAAPEELYANGLQRQKFIPTINLIKRYLKVIKIDNGNDYRLREMPSSPLFMLSDDSESQKHMQAIFNRLSAGTISDISYIEIQGRHIPVKIQSAKVVWFDFSEICGGLHAQQDYLEIANKYAVLIISDIPQLDANKIAEAQRLIWLVDILYDNNVKLLATTATSPDKLCIDTGKSIEFARTASRLVEMQTQSYLELPHHTESYKLT